MAPRPPDRRASFQGRQGPLLKLTRSGSGLPLLVGPAIPLGGAGCPASHVARALVWPASPDCDGQPASLLNWHSLP